MFLFVCLLFLVCIIVISRFQASFILSLEYKRGKRIQGPHQHAIPWILKAKLACLLLSTSQSPYVVLYIMSMVFSGGIGKVHRLYFPRSALVLL